MGRKKAAAAAAPIKDLPAEGAGGQKRTPQSAFDPAKGAETYVIISRTFTLLVQPDI